MEPEGCDGNRRTDQGQCVEAVQAGRLIEQFPAKWNPICRQKMVYFNKRSRSKKARVVSPGFLLLAACDSRGWRAFGQRLPASLNGFQATTTGHLPALPKLCVAPSFRPVRSPLFRGRQKMQL